MSMNATPDLVRCAEEVSLEQVSAGKVCNYGPDDSSPKVLVWGDSHALGLMPADAQNIWLGRPARNSVGRASLVLERPIATS